MGKVKGKKRNWETGDWEDTYDYEYTHWTPATLRVAAKYYGGVCVGFIVGYRGRHNKNTFRNIRHGSIFKTVDEAKAFRSEIENSVSKELYVTFEEVTG